MEDEVGSLEEMICFCYFFVIRFVYFESMGL